MKDKHLLRIIANVNAPWATSGYSTQTHMLSERIRDEGYPIALVNFYGLEGGILKINDMIMYPKLASQWGDDAMVYHSKDFKADLGLTLQDIWTMNPEFLQQIPKWTPIVPVDHDPAPVIIYDRLRLAYRIVTYSKFGQKQIEKLGFYSTYIQHAVDCNVLKPLHDKVALRNKMKIPPDMFIFGMVAANKDNPPRKSFQEAIDAFALFHKNHPNSGMFFHTLLQQQGGFPIETYWNFIKLPKDKLFFIQPYDMMFHVGRAEMAQVYNIMDCLVLPSTNEGFGVPAIEAQSCGIPAIVNNFTALPELIIPEKTGLLCDVLYKRFDAVGSYIGIPSTESIYKKMEQVFEMDREVMGKEARKWILENYNIDDVYSKKWSPFLRRIEKEVYPEIDKK